ncbi:MAG: amidohydrolase, partial [Sporomusa sp.]
MGQDITAATEKCRDYVLELRRHFRTWPELSTEEFKSQEKIMDELAKLGLEPRKIANTGVIADIIGGFPGRTIAVRADMDALALEDECGQVYQSKNPGVCHGCGHDGHMAMLLGIARVLCEVRGEIAGTVRLLFQPSEERYPGGALAMIAGGALEGVDAIIAAHLWQPIPVGTLGISYGRMMAQPGGFAITIQGKGGHASMPHQAVDPIRVGMQISQAINSITGCNMDP